MIVLDGATSQPNRSRGESCATGRPSGSPAAIRAIASRCGWTVGRSSVRGDRREPAPRRARLGRRGSAVGRHSRTTPAFTHSPRSMRGTTRRIAYGNGYAAAREHAPPPRRTARGASRRAAGSATYAALADRPPDRRIAREPVFGTCATIRWIGRVVEQRRQPRVGRRRSSRRRAAARGPLRSNGRRACSSGVAPRVLDVERRPVVDQPEPPVPHEHVRVPRRCGRRSRRARRTRRRRAANSGSAAGPAAGLNGRAPGQEVDPEVQPAARSRDPGSPGRARARRARVELDETMSGTGSPARAATRRRSLRDERPRPLAGAAELDHVHAVVVGLDERRAATRPRAAA